MKLNVTELRDGITSLHGIHDKVVTKGTIRKLRTGHMRNITTELSHKNRCHKNRKPKSCEILMFVCLQKYTKQTLIVLIVPDIELVTSQYLSACLGDREVLNFQKT